MVFWETWLPINIHIFDIMIEVKKQIDKVENYSIYASPAFLKGHSKVVEYGYIVEDDIVLPYFIRKSAWFKTMSFPVEILGEKDVDKQKSFLNRLPAFIKQNFDVVKVVTENTAVFSTYPDASLHCKFGSYIIDLEKSEDELFSSVHSKHRNVIRKAQKDGILIKHGKDYQKQVIELMNDTFSRQGLSATMDENYLKCLDELSEQVEYWISEDSNGNIQGSAIFLWNKGNSCYYLHGGSAPRTATGAMNLLIWEAMLYMKEKGVRFFDFVGARVSPEPGSKLEGIQRFKERFGSTLKVGHAFSLVINKNKDWLINIMVSVKYKIRGERLPKGIIKEEIEKGNI